MNINNTILTVLTLMTVIPASAIKWTADVTPTPGVVNELGEIRLQFKEISNKSGWELSVNESSEVVLYYEGLPVKGTQASTVNRTTMKVTMPDGEPMVYPGKYELEIRQGAIGAWGTMTGEDNPEPLKYEWTIENAPGALDFSYTSSLSSNGFIAYFDQVTLTFDKLDGITWSGAGISVIFNDVEIGDVSVTAENNKLTVALKDALNFVEGNLVVTIEPDALSGTASGVTQNNVRPFVLSYKMASPVEYDLGLKINSPVPNASGQISANKVLESIIFVCEEKGLVPAAGKDINVTIREVDGAFEAKAHLKKGNGFNKDFSYFSASFGEEPSNNGIYEITIDRGAFGTAAWAEDPNYGRTNAQIQINFELIDGVDREVYSLKPVSIDPAPGTYESGSVLSTVTLTFDEEVQLTKGTVVTLAGFDTSYVQTAQFKQVDGTYKVTFNTTPSEDGRYRLTVAPGAFTTPGFPNAENSRASAAISLFYIIDRYVTGADMIKNESDGSRVIYDLYGRRVAGDNLHPGIYIIEGKKVLVR